MRNRIINRDERGRFRAAKRFVCVALDESNCWDPETLARAGGKIWTLYVYDPDERTHVCELTPSYWLEPLEHVEGVRPEDEDEADRLNQDLIEAMDYEGTYVHCWRIDAIPGELKDERKFEDEATIDDARESFQSNGAQIRI